MAALAVWCLLPLIIWRSTLCTGKNSNSAVNGIVHLVIVDLNLWRWKRSPSWSAKYPSSTRSKQPRTPWIGKWASMASWSTSKWTIANSTRPSSLKWHQKKAGIRRRRCAIWCARRAAICLTTSCWIRFNARVIRQRRRICCSRTMWRWHRREIETLPNFWRVGELSWSGLFVGIIDLLGMTEQREESYPIVGECANMNLWLRRDILLWLWMETGDGRVHAIWKWWKGIGKALKYFGSPSSGVLIWGFRSTPFMPSPARIGIVQTKRYHSRVLFSLGWRSHDSLQFVYGESDRFHEERKGQYLQCLPTSFHRETYPFVFLCAFSSYTRDRLSKDLVSRMEEMEEFTSHNTILKVNVCIDYSGEWDIAQSCMKVVKQRVLQLRDGGKSQEEESVEDFMRGMHWIDGIRLRYGG